jgi:hypothetical protein
VSQPSDPADDFDATAIVACLNRHGVRYVVIGALAAQLQGAPIPRTRDIDVTPAIDGENLQRLSAALHELKARIRTAAVPEGLKFDHNGASLGRARVWNLTTPFGEFDLSFVPSGTEGYQDLVRHAHVIDSHGELVPVADLEDVIRSKEAAGRPKDILHLPILLQTVARQRLERSRESDGGNGGQRERDRGPDIDL